MTHFFALVLLILIGIMFNLVVGILTVLVRDEYWPHYSVHPLIIIVMLSGFLLWLYTGSTFFFTFAICYVVGALAAIVRDEGLDLKSMLRAKMLRRKAPYKPEDDPNWVNYHP